MFVMHFSKDHRNQWLCFSRLKLNLANEDQCLLTRVDKWSWSTWFFFQKEKIPNLDIHIMNQRTSYTYPLQPGFYLAKTISRLRTPIVSKRYKYSHQPCFMSNKKTQKPHANRPSDLHVIMVILSSKEIGQSLKGRMANKLIHREHNERAKCLIKETPVLDHINEAPSHQLHLEEVQKAFDDSKG